MEGGWRIWGRRYEVRESLWRVDEVGILREIEFFGWKEFYLKRRVVIWKIFVINYTMYIFLAME